MKEELIRDKRGGVEFEMKRVQVEDILLTHSKVMCPDRRSVHVGNNNDRVRLHFNLIGGYDFHYSQIDRSFKIDGQRHNIMYSQGIDLHIENHDLNVETFGIQFPLEFFDRMGVPITGSLKKFIDHSAAGNNTIYKESWPLMTPKMLTIIDEIINCKYNDSLKELFYFSKSLELLVVQLAALDKVEPDKKLFTGSKSDREKFIEAKRYIENNLENAPGLSETARHIGVNEYKLKLGFKEMFGATLFEFLTAKRLELATELLHETELSLAEISDRLGYSSPQHFNIAFKRAHDITPGAYRKS